MEFDNFFHCLVSISFICDTCADARGLRRINKYRASNIPKTQLSEHIEESINAFLRSQEVIAGKKVGKVTVRVVQSVEKQTQIKPNLMREYNFATNSYPYQ